MRPVASGELDRGESAGGLSGVEIEQVNDSPAAGVKPESSDTFRMPPRVREPVSVMWSYPLPSVVPPSSNLSCEVGANTVLPESETDAGLLPGL